MAQATVSTGTKGTNKGTNKGTKGTNKAALQVPATVANPFSTAIANVVKAGQKTAAAAGKGVAGTVAAPTVGTAAPVGVAARNAALVQGAPAGFAAHGCNGRIWPNTGAVTARIWQLAMQAQLAGTVPTGPSIYAASGQTINSNSAGLGLTQYWAYTGQTQCKGAPRPLLTVAQLAALPALCTAAQAAHVAAGGKGLAAYSPKAA